MRRRRDSRADLLPAVSPSVRRAPREHAPAAFGHLLGAPAGTPLERALIGLSLRCSAAPRSRPPRLTVDLPVRFRALNASTSVIGSIRNISVGGAYIHAPSVPSPGTLLAFGFYVRHRGRRHLLRSMGMVIWTSSPASEPPGFGLKFVDPPCSILQTIDEMVRARQQRRRR